ncbi:MAG TPA: four-carbon acid sugar kinase family protein [Tepidisphaeraceae bacterium]|nr:four-carbon acid sugar kinase family protein [Tepidisphaeraceae bacterium]
MTPSPAEPLPSPWDASALRRQAAGALRASGRVIVALDDDPTGSQTVHGVDVITTWAVDDLADALRDADTALYVLTNTRGMPAAEAAAVTREAAVNLVAAAGRVGRPVSVVSRSDSTLRGHFPLETDVLADVFGADLLCLVPCFPEGGRQTIGGVHYVVERGERVPAGQTPFARDATFGYRASHLAEWVEEKTAGRTRAQDVELVGLRTVRSGPDAVVRQLETTGRRTVAFDAVDYADVDVIAAAVRALESLGRRVLVRAAGAYVKCAAGVADRPLLDAAELMAGRSTAGGLVVVGSHVPKSTAQLAELLKLPALVHVELDAQAVATGAAGRSVEAASEQVNAALGAGRDVVVSTSRAVVTGTTPEASLGLSRAVSAALMGVVRSVRHQPRFVLGKGGITSHELATLGLGVRRARVLGQVMAGVSVWQTGPESRWPGVPYVVFPGNVGGETAVAEVVARMRHR